MITTQTVDMIEHNKHQADLRAVSLGHALEPWKRTGRWTYASTCIKCGADVAVGTRRALGRAVEVPYQNHYGAWMMPLHCEEWRYDMPITLAAILHDMPPPGPSTLVDYREVRWEDERYFLWHAFWRMEGWRVLGIEVRGVHYGTSVYQFDEEGLRRAVCHLRRYLPKESLANQEGTS